MVWPAPGFNNQAASWLWWSYQEISGKKYAGTSRFQRERWHLRALHDDSILENAAIELGAELAMKHGRADVRLGSIWVDLTPQARAKYRAPTRPAKVKCELADLVIVTMASFNGLPPSSRDVRALLVQAKVTDVPGMLDLCGPRSSTSKERNLLELCSSNVELFAGTAIHSTKIGTFDLGCTDKQLGLEQYSRYLTIPKHIGAPPIDPYQSMWPLSRSGTSGTAISLGDTLLAMLDTCVKPTIGHPLEGVGVKPDWQRMIRTLTGLYDTKVVDRFTDKGASPFPRIQQSSLHSCFMSRQMSDGVAGSLLSPSLHWEDMRFAFGEKDFHDGGHGNDKFSAPETPFGGPQLPVLLVQAKIGQVDDISFELDNHN